MKQLSKGREEIFKGMTIVFEYVSRTLGPNGENVVLDRGFNAPIITNDGVSAEQMKAEILADLSELGITPSLAGLPDGVANRDGKDGTKH